MSKDRSLSTAIHILAILGFHNSELVSSEFIAKGVKTNAGLIRRLLIKLSDAGLVVSVKGKGGGSRLAKPTNKISLEDIYMAINESPLFGSFDKEPLDICHISCNMKGALNQIYGDLEDGLKKDMSKVKLSGIMKDLE